MKCARCGKSMDKAAGFVGNLPYGSTCWDKIRNKPLKIPKIYRQAHGEDQKTIDMFDEVQHGQDSRV